MMPAKIVTMFVQVLKHVSIVARMCVSAVLTCYDIILLYVHGSRTVSVQSGSTVALLSSCDLLLGRLDPWSDGSGSLFFCLVPYALLCYLPV